MKTVRPVKWIVQPVFLADDGENLEELAVEPLAIPARDWEAWAGGGWRDGVAELQAKVAGAGEAPAEKA